MGLGPIEENVRFGHVEADDLAAKFRSSANTIEDHVWWQRPPMQVNARASWRGRYAVEFDDRCTLCVSDGLRLVSFLRLAADQVDELARLASEEQQRREAAREWQEQQEEKDDGGIGGWLDENIHDPVFGDEDSELPPPPPEVEPPQIPVGDPGMVERESPPSSTTQVYEEGGTSSAKPGDLDDWAELSRGLDDTCTTSKGHLQTSYDAFIAKLGWGSFDAQSLITGFGTWTTWNGTDASWVSNIAQSFRNAGTGMLPNATIAANLRAAGLAGRRSSITFDAPLAWGDYPTAGYANDPVNAGSGNFVESECDLRAGGSVRLLRFVRTYNSRSDLVGPFGPGWASWATCHLRAEPEGAVWEGVDGQRAVIPRDADGSYQRLAGIAGLVVQSGEGLAIEWFGGGRWTFDRDGLPVVAESGPGTTVRFSHDDAGRLVTLTHANGKAVRVVWDGERITALESCDGCRVPYSYDDRGRLVQVNGPDGMRRYEVDDRNRVAAVIDADGVVEARNTYDDDGRVVSQLSPHGRRTRFRYLPGQVTIVDDDSGGPTNMYVHDDSGRMVSAIDGHGNEFRKRYDEWGNPVEIIERNGASTYLRWDDRARLIRKSLPGGGRFSFAYDDLDRVLEVEASTGAVTRYRYDGDERTPAEIIDAEDGVWRQRVEDGLVHQIIDPDGVKISMDYDTDGNLTSVTDAVGNITVTERDAAGRVTATVSAGGLRTELHYDASGRVVERVDPGGARWGFEWSPAGRLVATVDPTGARTETRFAENGEAEELIDPLGHVTTRRFDPLGNLAGVVLPDGAKWSFDYDGLCRLTQTTDPSGGSWLREYNETGQLVGSFDPTGMHRTASVDREGRVVGVGDGLTAIDFELDGLGRPITQLQPDGTETDIDYDLCGRVSTVTDPLGATTRYEYTAAGRVAAIVRPSGATVRYEYDNCGRLVAVTDPAGGRWSYRYDAEGRVTQRVAATGEIERYRYDADSGRLAEVVSPAGGTTRYVYERSGRISAVTDPGGGTRRYRWDARGQLIEVIDANGGVCRFEHNERGYLTRFTDQLGGQLGYDYDALGRMVARTDQLGRTTQWDYDPAGRPVRRVLPTGERVRWSYDSSGRIEAIGTDDARHIHFERDLLGRAVAVDEPDHRHELDYDIAGRLVAKRRDGQELTWRYDDDGRRVAVGYPDGTESTYGHDVAGRISSISHPVIGTIDFERDAAGRLVEMNSEGGSIRWRYRNGVLAAYEAERGDQRVVTELERDVAGRVLAATTNGQRTSYTYDLAGQLVGVSAPDSSWAFDYDSAGRLVTETIPDGQVTYHYDTAHQLLERDAPDGAGRFEYDAAGRRISQTTAGGTSQSFSWDWLGRLDGIGETRLDIDAFGDLAGVDGHSMLWDPVGMAPQLRSIDGTSIVGAGQPRATVDPAGDVQWLHHDWQGSASSASTDPWGASAGGSQPGFGYRGELNVGGFQWLRHRAYDPATRSFLSPDPLPGLAGQPVAANPYHYAANNPAGMADPLGLRPMTEEDLAEYREERGGGFVGDVGEWWSDNWEYVAGGAMVIGGGVLLFTGNPVLGGALISGGVSTISQKATTGEVNWGQVGIDAAIGGVAAGSGAWLAQSGRLATVSSPIVRGAIVGGTEGFVGGAGTQGVNYLRTGEFNTGALARDTLLGGALGGGGGYVGNRLHPPTAPPSSARFVAGPDGAITDLGPRISPDRPIVLGEGMRDRVIPAARDMSADWYQPPFIPNDTQSLAHNRVWINEQMNQGRGIIDVGPAPGRPNYPEPTSPWYQMERDQIAQREYPYYKQRQIE